MQQNYCIFIHVWPLQFANSMMQITKQLNCVNNHLHSVHVGCINHTLLLLGHEALFHLGRNMNSESKGYCGNPIKPDSVITLCSGSCVKCYECKYDQQVNMVVWDQKFTQYNTHFDNTFEYLFTYKRICAILAARHHQQLMLQTIPSTFFKFIHSVVCLMTSPPRHALN